MRKGRDGGKTGGKKHGEKKKKRRMKIVATLERRMLAPILDDIASFLGNCDKWHERVKEQAFAH